MVEHGGDAVEPEAVEPKDVDPHPQVGQQEPEDLPLEVVEEARVPEGVGAARPGMEETRVCKNQIHQKLDKPVKLGFVIVVNAKLQEKLSTLNPMTLSLVLVGQWLWLSW